MLFEWNPEKARLNRGKHGVAFAEASTVFGDPLAYTFHDPDHALVEERWLTIGWSAARRVLVVCHADRRGIVRIISAREATKHEKATYFEG